MNRFFICSLNFLAFLKIFFFSSLLFGPDYFLSPLKKLSNTYLQFYQIQKWSERRRPKGGAPFVRMESVRIGVFSFLHFVRIQNRPLLELVRKISISAFCQNNLLMKKVNFFLLSEKYTELPFCQNLISDFC